MLEQYPSLLAPSSFHVWNHPAKLCFPLRAFQASLRRLWGGGGNFVGIEGLGALKSNQLMDGVFACSSLYSHLESQVLSKYVCFRVQTFWGRSRRKEPRRRLRKSSEKFLTRGNPRAWHLKTWESLSKDRSGERCQWCWESNKMTTKQCSLHLATWK